MDKLFEKYQKRMTKIGIFKSVIFSLAITFFVTGIVALITLFSKASITLTLALTFAIAGGAFILSVFLLYFKFFRPTPKMIVQKLDALGMEERYITMLECEGNGSVMAKLQRDDATKRLSNISSKSLKFTIAIPVIVVLVLSFLFAAGTTTISTLAAANVIAQEKPRQETTLPKPKDIYTVSYLVYEKGTGSIEGKLVQSIESGKNTTPVTAIAEEGYKFVAWVDENKNYLENKSNPRVELNVHENMTIYALFEKKGEQSSDDDVDGELNKGDGEQKPEGGGGSEGEGGDNQGQVGGGGNPSGGSGSGRDNNNVIDGSQDYKENFDREKYEQELEEQELPDELKDVLGDYYGTLKP